MKLKSNNQFTKKRVTAQQMIHDAKHRYHCYRRWEDNIKMDLREIVFGDVD
jgi:hypothetical protein